MKYRKLRIAWSVAWGVACLLLIALWVRSQWYADHYFASVTKTHLMHVQLIPGAIAIRITDVTRMYLRQDFTVGANNWRPHAIGLRESKYRSPLWAAFDYAGGYLTLPYWFLVSITAILTAAPWIKRRPQFSLRTLLIAMTLVAVGLGLAVYANRN